MGSLVRVRGSRPSGKCRSPALSSGDIDYLEQKKTIRKDGFFCLAPGLSVLPVSRFVPLAEDFHSRRVDAQGEQPVRSIHRPDLCQRPKRSTAQLELLKSCRHQPCRHQPCHALDPESYPLESGFHTMSNSQAKPVPVFCMRKERVLPSKLRR